MAARNSDHLGLDEQFCFAVYSAAHALNRAYKPLLDRLGVTYPQYLVLLALWEEDGRSVGSLGAQLMLESSTLTRLRERAKTIPKSVLAATQCSSRDLAQLRDRVAEVRDAILESVEAA